MKVWTGASGGAGTGMRVYGEAFTRKSFAGSRTRKYELVCGCVAFVPKFEEEPCFLNNKAKVTMRKSYGFRTYRVLELALYHSLGKLPEPGSTHDFF